MIVRNLLRWRYLHRDRQRVLQLLFILLFSAGSSLYGGAWTQKQRGLYLKISATYLYTTAEYDFRGNRQAILKDFAGTFQDGVYQESALKTYAEYGLFPRLTLIADLPVKLANSSRTEISNYFEEGRREASFSTTGFGDLNMQGRWRIIRHRAVVVSLQPGVKIPLYNNDSGNSGPQLGTGSIDAQCSLMSGFSLTSLPLYFSSEIGYRIRSGSLHDEYFGGLEAGLSTERGSLKAEMRMVKNTVTPPDIYGQTLRLPLPGGGGAVPVQLFGDQDYLKLNVEGVYKIGRSWGISIEIIRMLAGKNIISGTTFQTGIVVLR